MKKDYKENDSVIISKPYSMFDGLIGTIISNNPESTKQLKVDLNPNGVWQFLYAEVQEIGCQNKPVETINPEITSIVSSENKTPVKRAYSKRSDKPKEVKQKRAYNRKKVD